MTKADRIRGLADGTLTVAEIAAAVGIRYQHAYNVLNRSGLLGKAKVNTCAAPVDRPSIPRAPRIPRAAIIKPELRAETLLDAGFRWASAWSIDEADALILTEPLPKEVGVYAFVKAGIVVYIGVATMGLAKRIYFYGKPAITQRTSLRLNATIREELGNSSEIDILIAQPEDMTWNGLPVHGSAGLELGLIKAYSLPWNMRSSG
ncbi:GIY-YIG nuclease family protein [Sphingomonas sp. G-3-2-10]|uniref:GIY-YIG nuclease family protein n=1 Tax=Sphingomonas sp. G-3-2-10 TaxID=2728838 RepID=UPI00146DAE32|nr:GIY-YIG nuclease family protein [Sphingomonas sp. G-3-2-10]NML06535.1 GIY-YIG nuclease family protein [Sphingomonas sp. G-3-2-10]